MNIKLAIAKFGPVKWYLQKKTIYIDKCSKNNVSKVKIERFKNTKKGQRCFVIGNGPSLTVEDLTALKNEDTFASNRIFRVFDQTEWRPTYYFCEDTRVADEIIGQVQKRYHDFSYVFLNSYIYRKAKRIRNMDNVMFFNINTKYDFPNKPGFSEDVSKEMFEGFTVTYACIQAAVYMGYSEIYLVGIDHNYNLTVNADGSTIINNEVQNYMPCLEAILQYPPQLQKSTLAYQKARDVCEEKNIIIKNATRGGKLEVFERVNFDDIVRG